MSICVVMTGSFSLLYIIIFIFLPLKDSQVVFLYYDVDMSLFAIVGSRGIYPIHLNAILK